MGVSDSHLRLHFDALTRGGDAAIAEQRGLIWRRAACPRRLRGARADGLLQDAGECAAASTAGGGGGGAPDALVGSRHADWRVPWLCDDVLTDQFFSPLSRRPLRGALQRSSPT